MFELIDRAYGSSCANYTAHVRDAQVRTPMRLYASATGGLLDRNGEATLDAQGRLHVYVQSVASCVISVYDPNGGLVRVDSNFDPVSTGTENAATSVALAPTSAQSAALSAAATGGGLVVVDGSGILYDTQGNPIAAGGGGSTPLVGNLTSNSTTAALRADQGPAITALITAKYTKPVGGVPLTDLAAAVQLSLGAADSALQSSSLKTVNGTSLVGSGNISTTPTLKTVNGTSLLGTGDVSTTPTLKTINGNSLLGTGDLTISGGGGSSQVVLRTSINVTANGQTGKIIVVGEGTSGQEASVTAAASGAGDVVTLTLPAGFLLKSASFNCPAGFNTGTAFTLTYKDPFSTTSDVSDAVLPTLLMYNSAYVIQTQTNILVSAAAGGMVSIQKTGLTAATNYVWNLKVL